MRREFLWVLPIMLAVGLAGCGGGADDTESGTSDQDQATGGPDSSSGKPTTPPPPSPPGGSSPVAPVKVEHPLDLTYVADDFLAAVVAHPQRMLGSKLLSSVSAEQILTEEAVKDLQEAWGVHPSQIQQAIVMLGMGQEGPTGPPKMGFVLRFSEAVDVKKIMGSILEAEDLSPLEVKDAEKTYYVTASEWRNMAAHAPDQQTIVVAEELELKRMLTADGTQGPLAMQLAGIDAENDLIVCVALEPVRPLLAILAAQVEDEAPPMLAGPLSVLPKLHSAVLTANLDGDPLLQIALQTDDDQAAATLEEAFDSVLEFAKGGLAMAKSQIPPEVPPEPRAVLDLANKALDGASVSKRNGRVVVNVPAPEGFEELPNILVAHSPIPAAREAARRAKQSSNLKMIALAMLRYVETHGSFPPAAAPRGPGEPPISWRVRLLPFLEESGLYDRYRFDEPWDSEHNSALIEQMPDVFKDHAVEERGMTTKMVFAGPGTVFDGEKGCSIAQISDGLSYTLLAVRAGADKAVPWTKPVDLAFDPDHPTAVLGAVSDRGIQALFGDGRVRTLSKDLDAETFRYLIERADGQDVSASVP